ncbi:YdeI/OmpD-associated family protein [Microbacterium sp. Clip185]|uniref:YdeI/OmpD-associated family protein n=1 Tax=Microbacterium sp. Clip185 TaxID=3025663 RepID=UPI00236537E6|nr:YdeI/OmpD-associated family protein [Microbacterium sp. Clip185]WDG16666.1 YdeI/OmpD-associated family protein [Microbacterium sp. Clip185]
MHTTDNPLIVADVAAWRAWLDAHEQDDEGVWLVLAKKGTTVPTTLTYDSALEEALCSGWIDGQKRGRDEATFLQRYTPRRRASLWSQRNLTLVAALIEQGRMRPRGQAEIDRAKADGRWDRAYAGSATIEVPDDLRVALAAEPAAAALFERLDATSRYAVLHRIATATPSARAGRIARLVAMLAEGKTPHPLGEPRGPRLT